MKKKRFSVEQIVAVLKQAELGVPVAEVIRKVATSSWPKGSALGVSPMLLRKNFGEGGESRCNAK
jgi:hypothetical protein